MTIKVENNRPKSTNSKGFVTLHSNGKKRVLDKPLLMGIVNVSPDSFYSKSSPKNNAEMLQLIDLHIQNGAAIIDLGAVSTKPQAKMVSAEEEWRRLLPALKLARATFPQMFISVDTTRSEIAAAAAESGADMINDISGGSFDPQMFEIMGRLSIPFILSHILGKPSNMQAHPQYKNVTKEVYRFLKRQSASALRLGVRQIIVDPGFGFGKTLQHNYEILAGLKSFKKLGFPVLVGLSRKSMIYNALHTTPEKALNATTAAHTIALMQGVDILRVHDVKEAAEAIEIVKHFTSASV